MDNGTMRIVGEVISADIITEPIYDWDLKQPSITKRENQYLLIRVKPNKETRQALMIREPKASEYFKLEMNEDQMKRLVALLLKEESDNDRR